MSEYIYIKDHHAGIYTLTLAPIILNLTVYQDYDQLNVQVTDVSSGNVYFKDYISLSGISYSISDFTKQGQEHIVYRLRDEIQKEFTHSMKDRINCDDSLSELDMRDLMDWMWRYSNEIMSSDSMKGYLLTEQTENKPTTMLEKFKFFTDKL